MGRKGFVWREIYGKIKKYFTFFEKIFFLKSDQLMLMINIFLILRIL